MDQDEVLLGFHAPTRGGVDKSPGRLKELGCPTGQIFTKNSRQWKARDFNPGEVNDFIDGVESLNGPVLAHTGYLINLGNPEEEMWEKSKDALVTEVERAARLQIMDLILHPGLHVGSGEKRGIRRIVNGLDEVIERTEDLETRISLETTAGQGSSIGYRLEQLARIKDETARSSRISFCLDTCHLHASGYELSTESKYQSTMEEVEKVLGLENVRAIHLNDARHEAGKKKDRHADIGRGEIGGTGFQCLLNDSRWRNTPKILETPVEESWKQDHGRNLERLRGYLT